MESEQFSKVIELIKTGNKNEALPILKEILDKNPNHENAWLALSMCVGKIDKKKYCLEQALRINPENITTQNSLLKINQVLQSKIQKLNDPAEKDLQTDISKSIIDNQSHQKSIVKKFRKKSSKLVIYLSIFLAVFILLVLLGFIAANTIFKSTIPFSFLSTKTSTPTITSTFTSTPTNTQTITFTPSPTITFTPTPTRTITITRTPTLTYTSTTSPTPEPMTSLAKRAIQIAQSRGFSVYDKACENKSSCQAFNSVDPFLILVIENNGLITMTIWDESHSTSNFANPPGSSPPYVFELIWYTNLIDEIYDPFATSIGMTSAFVMDGTMVNKVFSMPTAYGYTVYGKLIEDNKMTLLITPP